MTDLAPPKARRLRQQDVMEGIKDYILRKNLRPGDPLPTEAELEVAVDASRTSVREAIKSLSALDIVEVRHGHGSFVGNLSMAALVESLVFRGLLSSSTDHRVLGEVVDVRQGIEQGQAVKMLESLGDVDIDALRSLADRMHALALEGKPYVEADREFHIRLLRPLGNDLVVQLTEAFWLVQARVAPTLAVEPHEWLRTADAHTTIVDAVAARDLDRLLVAIEEHYAPLRENIQALAAPARKL